MQLFTTVFFKQSANDIWDQVNDWSSVTFICVMKDNTIQRFSGFLDENYDGEIFYTMQSGL